jgi:hypothetical protein
MPFSRSNSRRWDMGLPWHEARDYFAYSSRRTTSPCQKDNCKRKRMPTVFWGIHRSAHYCWLPKDLTLDSPFFCEEVLGPLAQKMQPNSKKLAYPSTWFTWTMQGFTRQGQPKRNWMFPDSNARRSHRIARILHHSTFAFRLAENPAWTERI